MSALAVRGNHLRLSPTCVILQKSSDGFGRRFYLGGLDQKLHAARSDVVNSTRYFHPIFQHALAIVGRPH